MKKFLQGFCFVVALVFVFFLCQSVNANVLIGHVEKVQGRTCSCGGTLVVRSKIVTKPGPDDCYHCHGNGYNIINNKKWTCQYCKGTGKKLIQVEVKWLHCNDCGADYDYQ